MDLDILDQAMIINKEIESTFQDTDSLSLYMNSSVPRINKIIVVNSENNAIQEKIHGVVSSIKKHKNDIEIVDIDILEQISILKADLIIIPFNLNIDYLSCIASPIVKIYDESHYRKNYGKKTETWQFIKETLKI